MKDNKTETNLTVPLLDLKGQYASIKDEVTEAIERVVDSQYFILGPEVQALEQEIASYCGSEFAVGVTSGTDAILVSLMALGIGPGDEVITTPFTFFATVAAALRVGAKVVFVDIDPVTFNMDPSQVEGLITKKTKAIIPVHLFGQCVDMDPILEMAKKRDIPVIEDAAQAIGAQYKGRRAGSMGTLGCFSFFPSKNLGAFGDGGMVVTDDEGLAEKIKILRNQGAEPKYYYKVVGGNFRLDALQAAVLRVKLKRLDSWSEARLENARYYTRRLLETGVATKHVTPPEVVFERHAFNQYVIKANDRDGLKSFLQGRNIHTEIYYPKAIHLQECMEREGSWAPGAFPESEAVAEKVLALPIYPELTDEQKESVVQGIRAFYED